MSFPAAAPRWPSSAAYNEWLASNAKGKEIARSPWSLRIVPLMDNTQKETAMHFASGNIEPLGVTVEEAARLVGISRAAIYPLITSGEIRSVKFGSRRIIPVSALREWFENRDTDSGGGA